MSQTLLSNEAALRMGCFILVLAVMGLWEQHAAARRPTASKLRRWVANLGLVVINSVFLRFTLPILAIGTAELASARGWGLLNWAQLPPWPSFLVALLLLDLAIYGQHVAMHKVPLLWRLHRMHHSDLDVDTTTGLRFHPLEILLSMLYKMLVVVLLGPSAAAVFVFEVILNAASLFNHGNVRLPLAIDRPLRWLIVTPDMHRVHHSIVRSETDSNYGFNLPWWDRLFGTYRDQPAAGHEGMTIGLESFRNHRFLTIRWLLAQPFLAEKKQSSASVEQPGHVG